MVNSMAVTCTKLIFEYLVLDPRYNADNRLSATFAASPMAALPNGNIKGAKEK